MTAHYWASRGRRTVEIRGADGQRIIAMTVSGKREARQIAASYGALPWNF